MLRFVILAGCLLAAVTLFTRSRKGQRALAVLLALMLIYVVLKLTGLIDLLRPERPGY